MTAVLALASCVMEDITPYVQNGNDENMVLDFSIVVPEAQTATKSFAAPKIDSLTVVVFDEYGYLVQAVPAEAVNGWGATSAETKFKVTLLQSASPRTLHFVANCPVAANAFEYGAETDIMSGLITTDTNDAYWQKLSFNSLLEQNKTSINTAMTKIPMIRNFAKISLGNVVNTFQVTGYALTNVPKSGTVAPYNEEKGNFQAYSASTNYAALKADKYAGFMPNGVEINDAVPATEWVEPVTNEDGTIDYGAAYTYESTYGNGTAVIIRGKYNNGDESYYKVDLYDSVNENYNILRNIEYKINITNVVGPGYGSAESAAENVAGNNISNSIDTENLLNISDGKQRLFVEYTSKRVVSVADFTLKYKFIPSATEAPRNVIAAGNPSDTAPITITRVITSNDGKTPVVTDWYVEVDGDGNVLTDSEGYAKLVLKPQQQMPDNRSTVWSEDFIISSTYKGVTLSRKVKLYMVNTYIMNVSCSPEKVADTQGSAVTVNTEIPSDLPSDIFPLVFDIEAEKLTLYPNTSATNVLGQTVVMPVVTDKSINPDNSDYSFYFQRTLTLAEYKKLVENAGSAAATVTVPSEFLTNTSVSASRVFVHNPYFGTATTSFETSTALAMTLSFSGDGLSRYGAGQTFTLTFNTTKTGQYKITSKNFNIQGMDNMEFAMTAGEPATVTCSYSDWATAARISIEYLGTDAEGGTNPRTWTGPTRNVLYIPAGNLKLANSLNNNTTLYVNGSSTGGTIRYNNSTSNSAASITVNNLAENATLHLRYSEGFIVTTRNYISTEFTAKAAAIDKVTGITFTRQ